MSLKNVMMKLAVGIMRCAYAPMKIGQVKNQITIISRQSNETTRDIALLSDYIRENHPKVKCVVMCRQLETVSKLGYCFHMLSQMKNMARSKVIVLDGYCVAASVLNHRDELKIVQMWHAMAAIKKFGWQAIDMPEGRKRSTAEIMCMHKNYDYVIAPSQATGELFCEAFNTDNSKIQLLPLPKADDLLKAGDNFATAGLRKKIREEYGVTDKREVLLYVPTFRKGNTVDVKGLTDAVDNEKYKLIVKLHPLYDVEGVSDNKYDMLQWLSVCDRVITDYSALGIEATLTCKPIYYYVYDIDEYQKNIGLNIDPREEMPQATAMTGSGIAELLEQKYDFGALTRFREKYISVDITDCTKQLGDFIYELTC